MLTTQSPYGFLCPICNARMHQISPTVELCSNCGIIVREAAPFRAHLKDRNGNAWEVIGHLWASVLRDAEVHALIVQSEMEIH